MADVDGFTDAELRTKLIEFGFPVMPITGTTRKVMTKKLKILMENKNKINNESRRSLGKYSSEEESDDADVRKAAGRDAKSRRVTMAAPVSKVPARRAPPRPETDSENEATSSSGGPRLVEEKKVVTRSMKMVKTIENDFDTGSDTESEVVESMYKTAVNNHEYQPPQPSVQPTKSFLSPRKSPPQVDLTSRGATLFSSTVSPGRYTSFTGASNASDYAADRLNQIRSRLSLSTTNYNKPYTNTNANAEVATDDQVGTPFLSSFTRRLSQLSSQQNDYDVKRESIVENDTNGSSYSPKYMSRPVKRGFVGDYNQPDKRSHLRNNLVSCAVIAFALLFFVGLAILYLGMRDGQTGEIATDLRILYCDKTNRDHVPGKTCVLDEDLRSTVDFYRVIKPELLSRAIEHGCRSSSDKGYMTNEDAVGYVKTILPAMYNEDLFLANLQLLALTNPKWDISLIRDKGDETLLENPVRDVDELIRTRSSEQKIALAVLNPDLPWKCTIYNKLSAIFHIAIIVTGLFTTLYLTNTAYKYYKHYQQKQKDELYYMVERIVDTLQSNASEDGENFLVINHVRDMIIPINDRSRMERIWRKAVKFINENESRVRTEMQVVQGEPYEVWRWLGNPNLNTSGVRNKSWQGQAFETQVGSVNSLPCSPTPCLKIRGMVDDGDRNLHTIREAVLSKCAHQCRILHCAVDTGSQCVYLKCANQADAAVAYRSLHGWWYAGNLVTVKYLRLERYMQRYPDSPVSGPLYLKAVQPGTEWVTC